MARDVDVNCDLGETPLLWHDSHEPDLMAHITSANVATLQDSNDLELGFSSATTLNVTTAGNITQSGTITTTGNSKAKPNSSVNCIANEMYSPIRQSLETPRLPLHS